MTVEVDFGTECGLLRRRRRSPARADIGVGLPGTPMDDLDKEAQYGDVRVRWRLFALIGLGVSVAASTAVQGMQHNTSLWRPYVLIGSVMTGLVAVWQLVVSTLLASSNPRHQQFGSLSESDPRQVGPYRIVGLLGSGAMGRAYVGLTKQGQHVAVKVIREEYAASPEFRRRFGREVTSIGRVHSPYTLLLLDSDPQAARPWLVTPYIAGPSLQEAIESHGPWNADSVWWLASGVTEA